MNTKEKTFEEWIIKNLLNWYHGKKTFTKVTILIFSFVGLLYLIASILYFFYLYINILGIGFFSLSVFVFVSILIIYFIWIMYMLDEKISF